MAHGKARQENYKIQWDVEASQAAKIATQGQPFALTLLTGEDYDFSKTLGERPAVVVFWASWCGPCIEEASHLVKLYERYGTKIEFVSISIDAEDDRASLLKAVQDLGITYPVALDPDGRVLAKYAAGASIPLTFVVDSSGAVAFSHRNYQAGDETKLEDAIVAVLAP